MVSMPPEKGRFLIIIEEGRRNFSAYSPDLPGCAATGKTREETLENMRVAIEFHIRGLAEDNLPIPEPRTSADYVTVTSIGTD